MKQAVKFLIILFAAVTVGACSDSGTSTSPSGEKRNYNRAVYMIVDTSGTYSQELDKAQIVLSFLLGAMNPGDTLAVARVKSRSFSEKDIVAKATFADVPSRMHAQKRGFRDQVDRFVKQTKKTRGSAHTDITGAIIQAAEFLNETGSRRMTVLIFSDMQEELDKKTVRSFPIQLTDISIVALNVTKLNTDNIDPRRYLGRLESWRDRVLKAGAKDWKVVNDLEHLERMF